MLEELLIFTRGGLILWSLAGGAKGSPVDALVRSFLLDGRSCASGGAGFAHGPHALRWTFHNALGLVFVAVYRKVLHLLYVDDLLAAVTAEFARIYHPRRASYDEFGERFRQLHLEAEARASRPISAPAAKPGPAPSHGVSQPQDSQGGGGGESETTGDGSGKDDSDSDPSGQEEHNSATDGSFSVVEENSNAGHGGEVVKEEEQGGPNNAAFDLTKLKNIVPVHRNIHRIRPIKPVPKDKKPGTIKRIRDDVPSAENLDFSNPADASGVMVAEQVAVNQGKSMMDQDEGKRSTAKSGWFSSLFRSIAGSNAALEMSDLDPALKAPKDRLMTKNVAEGIAEKLCESVAASLVGKKLGSFTQISSSVQAAMEDALVRILTPRRSIDMLRDVHAAKERGTPYVIVFVGVNGVGKS
uniref:Uncharacterized protein n=1 Tax=Avena sativa TaxID=4498 RepID=A0ACD5WW43_AVESA